MDYFFEPIKDHANLFTFANEKELNAYIYTLD